MAALRLVQDPTLEQAMNALAKGNEIRVGMADIRKGIRTLSTSAGCEYVAGLLSEPEPGSVAGAFPIGRLLGTIRRVGSTKAQMWCAGADIRSLDRRVDALTDRQKTLLARMLTLYAAGFRERWEDG